MRNVLVCMTSAAALLMVSCGYPNHNVVAAQAVQAPAALRHPELKEKTAPVKAADGLATLPLSATENIAVGAVMEKLQAVQRDREALQGALRSVTAEIAKEHPGYHLDLGTMTIVRNAPKPPDPAGK